MCNRSEGPPPLRAECAAFSAIKMETATIHGCSLKRVSVARMSKARSLFKNKVAQDLGVAYFR